MKNNSVFSNEFIFETIGADLNNQINQECGQIIQKGIFPTNMNRGIKVYVHSNDHLPIHFHVESSQRYLDAKFSIDPLELIENNSSVIIGRDEKFIIKYFTKNEYLLKDILQKFIQLNPDLNYEE